MFVLDVSGIGCGSCVSKITKAIQSLDSEATVSVIVLPVRSTLKVTKAQSASAKLLKHWVSLPKSAPDCADLLQR